MTGTALTEAEEFSTIYDLDAVEMPTNLDYRASRPEEDLEVFQVTHSLTMPWATTLSANRCTGSAKIITMWSTAQKKPNCALSCWKS